MLAVQVMNDATTKPCALSLPSRRAGFTLLELVVALPIMLIAASMIASTIIAGSGQRAVNRENSLVSDAVIRLFEEMRNEEFPSVFAQYNADPFDDPGGPGTAPGHRFAVEGLDPLPAAADGLICEVIFPVLNTGGTIDFQWELREDIVDPDLGMPRDLNGDSLMDDLDHAEDYRVLPVIVVARWQSRLGPRTFRVQTLLTDWSSER